MGTDQATLVLASLLRAPRRFQSYDLTGQAKKQIIALEKALEEFDEAIQAANPPQALVKLTEAFGLLGATPASGVAEDLTSRKHPVIMAVDREDRPAEVAAWHAFLADAQER